MKFDEQQTDTTFEAYYRDGQDIKNFLAKLYYHRRILNLSLVRIDHKFA